MGEDVFGVEQTFSHFSIFILEGIIERIFLAVLFFVKEDNYLLFGIEHNLSVVLEDHLHHTVAQPEYNGFFGFQPLFDID